MTDIVKKEDAEFWITGLGMALVEAKDAEIERLRAREKDLTLEGLALIGRIEATRASLAGTDIGSLPNDYPTEKMAQDRMAEIERLRAALREIADMIPYATPDYSHRVWTTARAALGERT